MNPLDAPPDLFSTPATTTSSPDPLLITGQGRPSAQKPLPSLDAPPSAQQFRPKVGELPDALLEAVNKAPDPTYEWAKIKSSMALGEALGVPSGEVYSNYDHYTEAWLGTGRATPGNIQAIADSWKSTRIQSQISKEWTTAMGSGDWEGAMARVKELRGKLPPPEVIQKGGMIKWVQDAATFISQQEYMLEQAAANPLFHATTGAAMGIAAGSAAAGLGAASLITGGIGLATSTAVMAAGLRAAMTVEGGRQEAGAAFEQLMQAGVPIDRAMPFALGVGAINSALEAVQLGALLKRLPGIGKAFGASMTEGFIDRFVKGKVVQAASKAVPAGVAKAAGAVVAGATDLLATSTMEASTEVVQQFVTDMAQNAAADAYNKAGGSASTLTRDEVVKDLTDTFMTMWRGSLLTFGVVKGASGSLKALSQHQAELTGKPAPAEPAPPPVRDAAGAVNPAAAYKDEQGGHYFELVTTSESEGEKGPTVHATLQMGDPNTKDTYLTVPLLVHADSVTIVDVKPILPDTVPELDQNGNPKVDATGTPIWVEPEMPAGMAELVKSSVMEVMRRFPGMDIVSEASDPVVQTVLDELQQGSPTGALQYFAKGDNAGEMIAMQRDRDQIKAAIIGDDSQKVADTLVSLTKAAAVASGQDYATLRGNLFGDTIVQKGSALDMGHGGQDADASVRFIDERGNAVSGLKGQAGYRKGGILGLSRDDLGHVRALITATERSDLTSITHEWFHAMERLHFTGHQVKAFEKALAKRRDAWEVADLEYLADHFEVFLKEGKAPTEELKGIFQELAKALASYLREWASIAGRYAGKDWAKQRNRQADLEKAFASVFEQAPSLAEAAKATEPKAKDAGTSLKHEAVAGDEQGPRVEDITFSQDDYNNPDLFPGTSPEAPLAPAGSILYHQADVEKAKLSGLSDVVPPVEDADLAGAFNGVKNFLYTELRLLSDVIHPDTPWAKPTEGMSLIEYARRFFSPEGIEKLRESFLVDTPPEWVQDKAAWLMIKDELNLAKRIARGEEPRKGWGGDFLATNRKTGGHSWDFALSTCMPTARCSVCYAKAAATQMGPLSAARVRHSIVTALYPKEVGVAVAKFVTSMAKADAPILRVNGAGDTTFSWQVEAVNSAIEHLDRPVHIFSRSHAPRTPGSAGLTQISNGHFDPADPGKGVAVFKMGSVDKQLVKEYGYEFLRNNLRDRGIINSYLVGAVEDVPIVKDLRDRGIPLILHIHSRADIVRALDDAYLLTTSDNQDAAATPACPCALESGPFLNGCSTCLVSEGPCFAIGANLAMTPDGQIFDYTDIMQNGLPEGVDKPIPMNAVGAIAPEFKEAFERGVIANAYRMAASEVKAKATAALRKGKGNIVVENPRSRERVASFPGTEEGAAGARELAASWIAFADRLEAGQELEALLADRKTIDGFASMDRAVAKVRDQLHHYAGQNANLSPGEITNLAIAKTMDASEKDKETIRLATGWFKGPHDGMWRIETKEDFTLKKVMSEYTEGKALGVMASWSASRAKGSTYAELGALIAAPELFSKYPGLRDIPVYLMKSHDFSGSYSPHTKTIELHEGLSHEEASRTLSHEIQHAIQDIEGFDSGANPTSIQNTRDDLDLNPEFVSQLEALNKALLEHGYPEGKLLLPSDLKMNSDEINERLLWEEQHWLDTEIGQYDPITETPNPLVTPMFVQGSAIEAYMNKGGEVEARDVESRHLLTPDERRATMPHTTFRPSSADTLHHTRDMGPAEAQAILDGDDLIPDGWFVHGRAVGRKFADGRYVFQFTQDIEVAKAYSKNGGHVWMARPSGTAIVADFGGYGSDDMNRFIDNLKPSFDLWLSGGIMDAYLKETFDEVVSDIAMAKGVDVESVDFDELEDSIRTAFTPPDIVNTAAAFDNPAWIELLQLFDPIGGNNGWPDWVITPDGAVLIPGSDKYEATNLTESAAGDAESLKHTRDDLVYKSEAVARAKLQGPMPGSQILKMLLSNGVKAEELKWTGLDEFLATDEKIRPADFFAHLEANKLRIEEVVKGGTFDTYPPDSYSHPDSGEVATWDEWKQQVKDNHWNEEALDEDGKPSAMSVDDYMESVGLVDVSGNEIPGKPETKFARYVLPGGENYREVLFTLPVKVTLKSYAEGLGYKIDTYDELINLPADVQAKGMELARASQEKKEYLSGHWDEHNVVAHTRLNDRTVDGKRMLFIEEIQSDWHQEGRNKGYEGQIKYDVVPNFVGGARAYSLTMNGKASRGNFIYADSIEEARAKISGYIENGQAEYMSKGVPDAPFKKTWHEFTFKRILKQAVADGYDTIGWTTGEQQDKRYPAGGEQGDKIAHGMVGFYDKMLVDYANKLGKKWGVKVEDAQIGASDLYQLVTADTGVSDGQVIHAGFYSEAEAEAYAKGHGLSYFEVVPQDTTVHSLPITDEMRAGVQTSVLELFHTQAVLLSEAKASRTFDEFRQFMDFLDTMMTVEIPDPSIPADIPDREKWLRELYDEAKRPAKADTDFVSAIGQGFGLDRFLKGIWDVASGAAEDRDPRFAEVRQQIKDTLHPVIKANAARLGKSERELSPKARGTILTLIKDDPTTYRLLWAEVTGDDEGIEAAKAEIAARPVLKAPKALGAMTLADRVRLGRPFTDEVRQKIESGDLDPLEIQKLLARVKAENAKATEAIDALKTQIDEQTLDLTAREKAFLQLTQERDRTERQIQGWKDADAGLLGDWQKAKGGEEERQRAAARLTAIRKEWDEERSSIEGKRWNLMEKVAALQKDLETAKEVGRKKLSAYKAAREAAEYQLKLIERIKAKPSTGAIHWDEVVKIRELQKYVADILTEKQFQADFHIRPDDLTPGNKTDWMAGKVWTPKAFHDFIEAYPDVKKILGVRLTKKIESYDPDKLTTADLEQILEKVETLREIGWNKLLAKKTAEREVIKTSWMELHSAVAGRKGYQRPTILQSKEMDDRIKAMTLKYQMMVASWNDDRLYRNLLDDMGVGKAHELLVDRAREARSAETIRVEQRVTRVREAFDKAGIKPEALWDQQVKIETTDEGTVTKSLGQLMYYWLAIKDEDSMAHVLFGNLSSEQERESWKGLKQEEKLGIGQRKLDLLFEAFKANLTEKHKEILRVIASDWNDSYQPMADVAIDVYNMAPPQVDNYVALMTVRSGTKDPMSLAETITQDIGGRQGIPTRPEKGFLNSRVKIGPEHQTLVRDDLMGVWMESVRRTEHFIAFSALSKELGRTFQGRGSKALREEIAVNFGHGVVRRIDRTITEIANPTEFVKSGEIDQYLRLLRGNYAVAVMGGRLATIATQLLTNPLPFIAYAPLHLVKNLGDMALDPIRFLLRVTKLMPAESRRKQAEQLSAILRSFEGTILDEAFGRVVSDKKLKRGMRKFSTAMMTPMAMVIRYINAAGWKSVYDKTYTATEGDEATKKAAAVIQADKVLLETQVSYKPEDLSPMFKDGGQMMKIVMQFSAPLGQQWQQLTADIPYYAKNHQAGTALGLGVAYSLMGALLFLRANGTPDGEDDEQWWKRFTFAFFSQAPESVPMANVIHLSSYLETAATGYKPPSFPTDLFPAVNHLLSTIPAMASGEMEKAFRELGIALGMFSGAPTQAAKDYWSVIIDGDIQKLWGGRK